MAKVIKFSEKTETDREEIEKVEVKSGGLSIKFKFSKKRAVIIIVIVLIMLIPSVYFYIQYQSTKDLLQNPKAQTSAQTKSLVAAVGKLIELPQNEQPRLATVTDVTQLVGQSFFAKAKNGDKVLIYTQSGKAILYRESINKIIDVAPVNASAVGEQAAQQAATGEQAKAAQLSVSPTPVAKVQEANVMILNGTLTSGLAKAASTKIQSALPNITVLGTGDAANSSYQNTVVVDISGSKSEAANQVAKLLGGKVQVSVPAGEKNSTSDILVILGSDFVK